MTIINEYLIVELNRVGKEQQEIARLCGVTPKTIIRWKQGGPIPSDKLRILHENGFDVFFILTGIRNPLLANIANDTDSYDTRITKLTVDNRNIMDAMLDELEAAERRSKLVDNYSKQMKKASQPDPTLDILEQEEQRRKAVDTFIREMKKELKRTPPESRPQEADDYAKTVIENLKKPLK